MTVTARQLVATFVTRWADGEPVDASDARRAVDLLLGRDGGAA